MSARIAYTAALHDGAWRVVLATEGEVGYEPAPDLPPCASRAEAERTAEARNTALGLDLAEAFVVVASAQRAQEARDAAKHGPAAAGRTEPMPRTEWRSCPCGETMELRPYGPGGSWICFPCAMKNGAPRRLSMADPTAEEIARLRALLAGADRLPWHADDAGIYLLCTKSMVADEPIEGIVADEPIEGIRGYPPNTAARIRGRDAPQGRNLRLIAGAVNALPLLLDALESTRATLATLVTTDPLPQTGGYWYWSLKFRKLP